MPRHSARPHTMAADAARGRRHLKAVAVGSLLLLLVPHLAACGEDVTLYPVANRLTARIHAALVARGVCADTNDCSRRRVAGWGVFEGGVDVSLFGVTDARVVHEIVGIVGEEFATSPRRLHMILVVYRETHDAYMARTPRPRALYTVAFERPR